MTDSSKKKSKEKRYRSDSGSFDSVPVGLIDDLPDEEDAIDRLLMNADFVADDNDHDRRAPDYGREAADSASDVVSRFLSKRKADPVVPDAVEIRAVPKLDSFLGNVIPATSDLLIERRGQFDINGKTASGYFDAAEISTADSVAINQLGELKLPLPDEPLFVADLDLNPFGAMTDSSVEEDLPEPPDEWIALQEIPDPERDKDKLIAKLVCESGKAKRLSYLALALATLALVLALMPHFSQGKDWLDAGLAGIQRHEVDAENKIRPATVEKPATIPAKSAWYLNLGSFRQRADAAAKASELIRKGVRTEMVEVEVDHAIVYRLRVGGFSSREQAAMYAEKIKKPLHLDSVWIDGQ